MTQTNEEQDSEELAALFDSISSGNVDTNADAKSVVPVLAQESSDEGQDSDEMEMLFDSIASGNKSADPQPGIQNDSDFQIVEKKISNAVNAIQPVVESIKAEAYKLSGEWQKLFDNQLDVDQFKVLAKNTHDFLSDIHGRAETVNDYLAELTSFPLKDGVLRR